MSKKKKEIDYGNTFNWPITNGDLMAEKLGITSLCRHCGKPVEMIPKPADRFGYYHTVEWTHSHHRKSQLCVMGSGQYKAEPRYVK